MANLKSWYLQAWELASPEAYPIDPNLGISRPDENGDCVTRGVYFHRDEIIHDTNDRINEIFTRRIVLCA